MTSLLSHWEREEKRMEQKDWVSYKWEDLAAILSSERLEYLQKKILGISRFKNDEGKPLGRKYGYDPEVPDSRYKWVAFRDKLKPFYIYKNKFLVLWIPNLNKIVGGELRVMAYEKSGLGAIKSADWLWATENSEMLKKATTPDATQAFNLFIQQQWVEEYLSSSAKKTKQENRLVIPTAHNNSKCQNGGTLLALSRNSIGTIKLSPVRWNDKGKLRTLKDAKKFAENMWALGDNNESGLRWMRDRTVEGYESLISNFVDYGVSTFIYEHSPLNTNDDLLNILERPHLGFIINWHIMAPKV